MKILKTWATNHVLVATIAAAFFFTTGFRVEGATITWTNTAGNGWSTAANWNPNSVPGASDTAIITNAGVTVSLNTNTTVGAITLGANSGATVTLSMAGQTLALNGPLAILPSGSFTVDSGTLTGNSNAVLSGSVAWTTGALGGTLAIATNSTLTVAGGIGVNNMPGCALTNYGTVAWASGTIQGGNGTSIYNYGLWDAQSDQTFSDSFGGVTTFNNLGTFRKSVGGTNSETSFQPGIVFNQRAGVLDVQNGNLALLCSGNFTGGYVTTNLTAITYLGTGNFTINGTVTSSNVVDWNANLVGVNILTGGFTWTAGSWTNATVTIATNCTVTLTADMYGNNIHNMPGCTLTNYGTVAWANGPIQGGLGTTIYNYGLWDAQSDQILNDFFGGAMTFNNLGTFRKSAGITGSATIFASGTAFNQSAGVLDVQTGNLVLRGSDNFTGGYVTTNATAITYLSIGNFTINGAVMSSNVQQYSANLAGVNVIRGALTWVGGSWTNTTVTIATNGSVIMAAGGGANNMPGCTLTNYGTVAWASGTIQGGNGTSIYNYGLWDAQSDQNFSDFFGGVTTFNNLGAFRKSAGSATNETTFGTGIVFNQRAGVLDVQNGNLALLCSGNFTGGYVTTNLTAITYLGTGNFTINGTVTSSNVVDWNANLVGVNVLTGGFTWTAGSWTNAAVTIATNCTVTLTADMYGNNIHNMPGCTLTNYGTVAWANGPIQGGLGTTIYNYGLWDAQSDQILNDFFGGAMTFNNLGTFRKSAGTTTNSTVIDVGTTFNQSAGVLDAHAGNLTLNCSGSFTGGYVTTNATAITYLSVGNFTINGAVMSSNVQQYSANLAGVNVIRGALTWVGGSWANAAVTIATNSSVIMAAGGAGNNMPACALTNYGTVAWSSGPIHCGLGTTIYNYGLWNAQSDQVLDTSPGGGSTTFNNLGTFRKSGSSGGSTQIQSPVSFNNLGTLDSQLGNISLEGAYSMANGTLNFGINSLTNYGTISLNGAAALTGSVSANLNNGYQPSAGNSFTNLGYSSFSGAFTNAILPSAVAWSTNYYSGYFVLTALNGLPVFTAPATNLFVVNELATLTVTNTATEANSPPQILTYSLAAGINGMAVNPGTGLLTWTPQQTNSPSTNTVAVAVTDNGTPPLSATNTYTVIVQEVNAAPSLPIIPTQTVNELTLLSVTNTATNANIHSTNSGYKLVGPPAGMSISANGIITWTPAQSNSPSTNTITTIVTNGNPYDLVHPILTSTNQFTVIVTESNVAPSLPIIPIQTVNELTLLSVTNTATNANIHSTNSGYKLVSPPAGMSINASGVITWTPPQTNSPSTNTITTIVTNGNPYDLVHPILTSTNQFTVIVTESNVAPSLPTIPIQTVNELTLLSVTNTATNANIHSTNSGYKLVGPPAGMSINASGVITWTPPQTNSPSTNTITTIVTNGNPYDLVHPILTSTNQFTVIVTESNVAPSLPTIPIQTVNELTLLSVTNTATNANIHSTNSGYKLVGPPAGMSISANGIITWTPAQSNSPSTNTITTIVTNGNPYDLVHPILTSTNQFTVIVTESNAAPSLPTIPIQTVNELTLLTVTNTAANPNVHSTITGYALVGAPSGVSIDTNGLITWTPPQTSSPSTNTITTIVTNSNPYDPVNPSLTGTNQFTVIVNEVNIAPTLPTIPIQTVNELTLLTITNTATNANIHSTNSGYALVSPPTGMSIDTNGIITWTPPQTNSPSTNTITTIVTNGNPYDLLNPILTSTNQFTVIVTESNAAPSLPTIPIQTVNELTLLTVTNTAANPNVHSTITGYALVGAPSGVSIDTNGLITWTPPQTSSPSTNTITTIVTNSNPYDPVNPSLTGTNQFTVIVNEVNIAPTLPTIPIQTVNELTLLTVTNTATNANIHSTNSGYALVSPPTGMSIDTNGIITWTPPQTNSPSTNTITTIVTNGNPYDLLNPILTSTNQFTVIVTESNAAPSLPTIPIQTVNELTLLTVTNTAANPNVHSTITGYALVGAPSGVSIDTNGLITWTPPQTSSPSTNTITTIVTNSNPYDPVNPSLTSTNQFTVIVNEVNIAPTLPTIPIQTVNELTLLTITNTATNANIHSTNSGYALVSPPTGMSIDTNGIITWTPPQTNSPSTNTITTIVTNGNPYDLLNPSLTSTNQFTVVVNEVNIAPTLPTIPTQTVNELALLSVTDTATNANIHSTITGYALVDAPSGMSIDTSGIITWTTPQATSTNIITTIVTNSNPYDPVNPILTSTNQFTVIVNEVNIAPTLPTIPIQTVNELTLLTVTNTAANPNIHSTITGYALVGAPSGVSIDTNGLITWTPPQTSSPSTNTITTIVTNSNPYDPVNPSLTSTNQFTVIVNEVNIAPTLPTMPIQTVNELTLLTVTNTATNANIHSTNSGYALVSPPTGMSIDTNGIITWTPPQTNSPSTNTITTIVTNGNPYDLLNPSLTSTNQFTVVVNEVNIAPTLPTIPTQTVNELALLSVTDTATNANIHSTITGYALVDAPSGMSIDTSGIITWTTPQATSTNIITTIVTNSNPYDPVNPILTSTNQFTVIVNEVNIAPTLPTIPIQTVNELTLLTVTNTAANPNIHSTITGYALVGAPSDVSIDTNGLITWTPPQTNSPSTNTITTIVTNSNPYDPVNPSLTSTNQFTVIVNEVNIAPTLPTMPIQTVNELTLLTVTNTATNANIHSTNSGYALVSPPTGMSIDTNGIITWTPPQTNSPSTNTITTIVTNGNPYDLLNPSLTSTNQFTVVVNEVNIAPTLPTIPTQTVNELALLSVTDTATNANIHSTITGYALVGAPSGMSIDTSGIITWTTPQATSTNIITTIVTNNDPYDPVNPILTSTNQFTVIVNEVNIAPTLPTMPIQTVNELTLLTVTNTASNPNIHSTITGYALVGAPSGVSIDTNGLITWTPPQTSSPSTNTITTIVTNSNPYDPVNPSLTSTNQFTVIVNEVNIAPTLPTMPIQTVNELTLLTVTNTATNANIHSTNSGYALVSPPTGMSIDTNGIITWTPPQTNSPSTNTITTIVTNGNPYDLLNPSLTSTNQFTVIVNEVNVAPTLPVISAQTITLLQPFSISNSATESNIHSVTTGYSLLAAPPGVAIDGNGIITWTPAQNQSLTTNTITTVASNSNPFDLVNPQLSSTNSFSVMVAPSTMATNFSALVSDANNLTLSWAADHTGWRLEVQTNALGNNWTTWPGSSATNQVIIPIDPGNTSVFFLLVYP